MKILRLNAYYTPESGAGNHLTEDLLHALAEHKFFCKFLTPEPTRGVSDEVRKAYKSKKKETLYDGYVEINRFSMMKEGRNPFQRALRYFCCTAAEYSKGIHEKEVDVVFSSSTPPTQGLMSGLVAKKLSKKYGKHVPFVFNLQDIFPDSLVNANMTHKGSLIWKVGRKMEDATYRNADKIIVISESMKRNILEKGVPAEKIVVVPNWIDTEAVRPVPKDKNRLYEEFHIDREKFTVLYAGNFGAAQGAHVVLEAARQLRDQKQIQFVIFGGGAEFDAAKRFVLDHKLENVVINGLLPQNRVSEVYSLGDVALITCKKGVGNSGMPSKTWSIMACNTPIIAAFDIDSELNEILHKSGAGVCVPAEDVEALSSTIRDAYEASNMPNKKEVNSRQYAQENASRDACVSKYIEVIKGTVSINL